MFFDFVFFWGLFFFGGGYLFIHSFIYLFGISYYFLTKINQGMVIYFVFATLQAVIRGKGLYAILIDFSFNDLYTTMLKNSNFDSIRFSALKCLNVRL